MAALRGLKPPPGLLASWPPGLFARGSRLVDRGLLASLWHRGTVALRHCSTAALRPALRCGMGARRQTAACGMRRTADGSARRATRSERHAVSGTCFTAALPRPRPRPRRRAGKRHDRPWAPRRRSADPGASHAPCGPWPASGGPVCGKRGAALGCRNVRTVALTRYRSFAALLGGCGWAFHISRKPSIRLWSECPRRNHKRHTFLEISLR